MLISHGAPGTAIFTAYRPVKLTAIDIRVLLHTLHLAHLSSADESA